MLRTREKKKWPAYTSWFDRNEFKINIVLWLFFFILLFVARQMVINGIPTKFEMIIWLILFIIDLVLLSFISKSVQRNY